MLRQGGIINIAIVLYIFRRNKVRNVGAEMNRAHTSWLPYAVLASHFQKGCTGISEGREEDEVGDQKRRTVKKD